MNVCPFRMQAGMVIEAQKTRLAVAGRSESSPMKMDLGCIGVDCMAFTATGLNDKGEKIGGCGIGSAPIFIAQLGLKIDALNAKIDAITVGTVEAIESRELDAEGMHVSFPHRLAKKLRAFFSTPEPEQKKGNLSAVPKETN